MSISSKALLSIDSNDKNLNTPTNNTVYSKFNLDMINVNGWGVSEYYYKDYTFNITPFNNRLFWQDIANSYEIEIVPGNYTDPQFVVALQAAMVAITPGVIVSEAAGVFTITGPTPIEFLEPLNPLTNNKLVDNGKLISDMLFLKYKTGLNLVHVGLLPAELVYSKYVDICSPNVHKYAKILDTSTNSSVSNILFRVYLDNNNTGQKELNNIKWINTDSFFTNNNINISVYDSFGNLYYDPDDLMNYSFLMMLT